ncbi:hypothetical protein [Paenibacillus sp. Z3-2]
MAGPLDTRQTSGAGVAGVILLWLVRTCARGVVRRFRWPQAIGQRTPRGCVARQARRAAASPGCPGPCCSARRGLRARAMPAGQLLRLAALAPVAPQGGA